MNEYLFGPIETGAFDEVSDLLVDCFIDDPDFVRLFDEAERRRTMREMFLHSLGVCVDNGLAFGWRDARSGTYAAVSLWFDYNKLRRDRAEDFRLIFHWPGAKNSAPDRLASRFSNGSAAIRNICISCQLPSRPRIAKGDWLPGWSNGCSLVTDNTTSFRMYRTTFWRKD